MDFELSDEHKLLRDSAREFVAKELQPEVVRDLDERRAGPPPEIWRKMSDLGWLGLGIPESYGGAGGDLTHLAVLTEELARGWASLTFDLILSNMASRLFLHFGSDTQRELMLSGIASGSTRFAWGLTEPGGGTDLLAAATRASLDRDGWQVSGQKLYTSRAPEADYFVVLARTDLPGDGGKRGQGLSLLLVPAQEAIEVRKLALVGFRSGGTSEVFFDDARAPADAIVGERGRGFYHLVGSLDAERITCAALGVGIAQAALDEALTFAKQRTAFGRPIGAFQALQHSLADMAMDIECARLLTQKAAWLASAGQECAAVAAMANVTAGEVAVRCTDRGMRIMGGHGMTQDSPMERHLRDARLQVISPISNEMARNFIGERLGLPRSY